MHRAWSDPQQKPAAARNEPRPGARESDSFRTNRKPVERKVRALTLADEERQRLLDTLARPTTSQRYARRVRVILLSGEGLKGVEIAERLRLSVGQVSRIRKAFLVFGLSSLADKPHPGRRDHAVPPETIELITRIAASAPPVGHTRWSTRLIAAKVGLTSATIAKVLRKLGGQQPVASGCRHP